MPDISLYDTSLRDGAQMEGISYSVEEKLAITHRLDELGVHFIEGGWPGSNPKDAEFFARIRDLPLRQAVVSAFSSTRRANVRVQDDVNIQALVEARTPAVTFVGKSWDLHVTRVLNTTLDENLAMIGESVAFMRRQGRRVFFDAEHFFDGYRANPTYALQCLRAAADGGAETLVLCDTNGGILTSDLLAAITRVQQELPGVPLGIHTHNDCDLAVANSIAAIQAGVIQVQGTVNGYGERCGNANLCSIIPILTLKLGHSVMSEEQVARLTDLSRFVSELANLRPDARQPFVGSSAFTHKAGLHVDALGKVAESYQHIAPERVGNVKRVLVSELSGRANIVQKAREMGHDLESGSPQVRALLDRVKTMESKGFQYDVAEASYDLLVRRSLGSYQAPFELVDFLVLVEKHRRPGAGNGQVNGNGNGHEDLLSEATVKVRVGGQLIHTVAEGDGPVNALDLALRKALSEHFPGVGHVRLVDYTVRILEGTEEGTAAQVRVLIESSDGERDWRTVGCSTNIIEASWQALTDSLEYWLLHRTIPTPA